MSAIRGPTSSVSNPVVTPKPVVDTPTAAPKAVIPGFQAGSSFSPAAQSPVTLSPYVPNIEQMLVGQLPPAQQAEYQSVQQALADNPQAQGALTSLLYSGKLTSTDRQGQTLLDNLSKLAQPGVQLQGGMDPKALLGNLVQETANPASINQGQGNYFCGATAASVGLAHRSPAEYARLVTSLATDGKVTLSNSAQLSLPPGFSGDDGSGRSLSQQLLAQPLTQMADGSHEYVGHDGTGYVTDKTQVGNKANGQAVYTGPTVEHGTFGCQVARMQSAMYGESYQAGKIPDEHDADHADGLATAQQVIQEQATNGAHPAVEKGHHWYSVVSVNGNNVTYADERGHQSTDTVDNFLKGADAFTYDTRYSSPPTRFRDDGSGGPGGGWNHSAGTNTPGT